MNKTHKTKRPNRKTVAIATGIALAILVAIIGLLTASCSTDHETADAGPASRTESIVATENAEEKSNQEGEAESDIEAGQPFETGESDAEANENAVVMPQSASQQSSNGSTKQDPKPSATSTTSTSQERWIEDTEQIWVEDRAAWSEQIPIYGSKEVSICNVCGADVTGNAAAHGKAHMLAGEGSGHHSEVQQTITGYETVSHPAEGHYETRVVGGHWE